MFFKVAVYLKHFTIFQETIDGGVFLLAKCLKNTYSYGRFLDNFFKFFRAAFLTLSGDCFRKTKNPSGSICPERFFKIAVLTYSRKLPGNYSSLSALLAKIKKSTPPRSFSLEFFRIFQNS